MLIVDQLLNAVSRALSEGKHIEIRGFGTFKVRERKARKARNPRSGAEVMVPAKLVPVFKASNELRITSYNVCYTKLLRSGRARQRSRAGRR